MMMHTCCDWSVPEALASVVRPGGSLLIRAGGGERVLDALLLDPARVTVSAETLQERAVLELRVRALELLPPEALWDALGRGRCPPGIVSVLLSAMDRDCAGFWRRRRGAMFDLHRQGRAGWLQWALDLVLSAMGARLVDDWARIRWSASAILYAAFAMSPLSLAMGVRRTRLLGDGAAWHPYCVHAAEVAHASGFAAPQWDLISSGSYARARPPPYLRDPDLARSRLDRIHRVDAGFRRVMEILCTRYG